MFTNPFVARFRAISFYVDEGADPPCSAAITLEVETKAKDFLDDVLGTKAGLRFVAEYLAGDLPIDGEIPLALKVDDDVAVKIPGVPEHRGALDAVTLPVPRGDGYLRPRVKIQVYGLSKADVGEVAYHLGQSPTVLLTHRQLSLLTGGQPPGGDGGPPALPEHAQENDEPRKARRSKTAR